MNDFFLQLKKTDSVLEVSDMQSKRHNWLGCAGLLDRGAVSYIYKNEILKRTFLVVGNAIPRKKARQKADHWLKGSQLISEPDAVDWCKAYNGIFIFIFIDELQGCIQVITDFLGFYPLYKYEDRNQICLSNSMKWLAKVCIQKPEWNTQAMTSYLHNGHLMFDQSWFHEIKRCEPASLYHFSSKTKHFHSNKYWSWEQLKPKRCASRKAMEEYADLFHQSVTDFEWPDFSSIGIGLSGGLDSRWIAQILARNANCTAHCFSFEKNRELNLSRQVAAALNIPHVFHELSNSRWLENRLETFWQSEGCLHLGHLHEGNLHRELFEHTDVFFHGFYGGGIYGGPGEWNRRIRDEVAARYFKVEKGNFKLDDPFFNASTIDPYIVHQRMRYQAAYSIFLLSGYTKIAVPFYDLDWMMYNYSIDDRNQAYSKFYLEVLNRELSADLLGIPWQRTGIAPQHIRANCFILKYKLNAVWERVNNLFGKSRHFINYSDFDDQLHSWIRAFAVDIQQLGLNFPLKTREHKWRMLSLVLWLRMVKKDSPYVL